MCIDGYVRKPIEMRCASHQPSSQSHSQILSPNHLQKAKTLTAALRMAALRMALRKALREGLRRAVR